MGLQARSLWWNLRLFAPCERLIAGIGHENEIGHAKERLALEWARRAKVEHVAENAAVYGTAAPVEFCLADERRTHPPLEAEVGDAIERRVRTLLDRADRLRSGSRSDTT